jgi:hypothetical protein
MTEGKDTFEFPATEESSHGALKIRIHRWFIYMKKNQEHLSTRKSIDFSHSCVFQGLDSPPPTIPLVLPRTAEIFRLRRFQFTNNWSNVYLYRFRSAGTDERRKPWTIYISPIIYMHEYIYTFTTHICMD